MKEIIFLVEKDIEGGYVARALGYSIFTEGDTIEELKKNIRDALKCHFDREDEIPRIIRLHKVEEEVFSYAWDTKRYIRIGAGKAPEKNLAMK